ncbi:TIGR02679 family protein [Actinokineospora alba]|uniref:TIGR02679 family protein n=1 Tax=Actinokineospora alba TaxID=504798 RepID=A0A1H0VYU8_9PSEU|nr:DUF2399 domain-containing protein [Actinokineospora alba]TDP67107.1 uncharacterized protein (TIGR02679 family) [Actinokineospora alba]SDJ46688.1 TIGR02679 family protein [Actinokineospora alba]SDP83286.1 TIGR02679 family protein [Actinokineospora alba]
MPEVYGRPEYEVLWRQARKAVARGQVKLGYKAPNPAAAAAVSALIGRDLTALVGTTIAVADLDERLRASEFHCGLDEVLAAVHGEAAVFSPEQPSVDASRREWSDEILTEALTTAGLQAAPWAPLWIDHVRRYAKIPPERLAEPAAQATAILSRLTLTPGAIPSEWIARTDLAAGPRALDRGQKVAGLVLRAAALAHGLDFPKTAGDERALWERCGVAPDGLSTTVLTVGLPLPRHADLRDLVAAPKDLVQPGTVVWVCENPRLVEASIDAGLSKPLVCLSGHLNTVARQLLSRLAASGAAIRCHADFDRTGLLLTRQVLDLTGGTPWRMGADDYREGLDLARAENVDLPPLGPDPGAAPWEPALTEALRAGWAVEEEVVLPLLLADLS